MDALQLVTGSDSDLSDFSDDEGDEEDVHLADESQIEVEPDAEGENDDDESSASSYTPKKITHSYRWKKTSPPQVHDIFNQSFSEPKEKDMTPLQYFKLFLNDETIDLITNQTNLYSTKKTCSSINVTNAEMSTFIGIHVLMGIMNFPSYTSYWSRYLRSPQVADAMPQKRFEKIRKFLHFRDNDDVDSNDKLTKVRPIIEAVTQQCHKLKPEEYNAIDEQIIPSKTKFSKIRQYNPKKPNKWGFKNLVRAGASGMINDFYIYDGKASVGEDSTYTHLQKSAQVVAKLCQGLPTHAGFKVCFDNWFSTLDLMRYLQERGILAIGTIRANRIKRCPLTSNKELEKSGRGSSDHRVDLNSGIVIVKWVDNSTVTLVSNYVRIEPEGVIERWCSKKKQRVDVPCPRIVYIYNKKMGGVDLADMLISLYHIQVKTRRWYIKIFWHLVDICKVNAWLLYRRHYKQSGFPARKAKSLMKFSCEIAEALIYASKTPEKPTRGRPSKRKLSECTPTASKRPGNPLPVADVRYDSIAHWPASSHDRKRCRVCHAYVRMKCEKCNVSLCLLPERNCFKKLHVDA